MATLCELNGDGAGELDIITPEIDTQDGCEILGKAQIFSVQGGSQPTLEWIFRDQQGNPVDLCGCVPDTSASGSLSASGSGAATQRFTIQVRLDKLLKMRKTAPVCWDGYFVPERCEEGVVRAQIPLAVAKALAPGVYQLHWAIMDNSIDPPCPKLINRSALSWERSLFDVNFGVDGPPTIQEIRLQIRDSSPAENLLLQDVEFSGEEIIRAIVKPVSLWNETPPDLTAHRYTTCNFPFRENWMTGIQGELMRIASHWYRRNRMNYQAAGVSVDDNNKEREYLQAAHLFLDEYQVWMTRKKVELNARGAFGEVSSPYGFNQSPGGF